MLLADVVATSAMQQRQHEPPPKPAVTADGSTAVDEHLADLQRLTRANSLTAPPSTPSPAACSASATSAHDRAAPKPTAKPNASSAAN